MRFAQIDTSDEDDDNELLISLVCRRSGNGEQKRKRRRLKLHEEDEEESDLEEPRINQNNKRNQAELHRNDAEWQEKRKSANKREPAKEDIQEEAQKNPKPIGDVIRVSGKGRGRRKHYKSFEYNGLTYALEDPVLLLPQELYQKPYVVMIKDIHQTYKGDMVIDGQWFYRPEEAEKKRGGNWDSSDARELFYSYHRGEVPAEWVMHRCAVHFVPCGKPIPDRKQQPGFFVQSVYDPERRRLFNLTHTDFLN